MKTPLTVLALILMLALLPIGSFAGASAAPAPTDRVSTETEAPRPYIFRISPPYCLGFITYDRYNRPYNAYQFFYWTDGRIDVYYLWNVYC